MKKAHTEDPAVHTIPEACRILRIGRTAGYEGARRGEIPTIRIGKRILVPAEALRRLLERVNDAHAPKG